MIPVIIFTDKIAGLSVRTDTFIVEGTKDTMEQQKFLNVKYAERGSDVYKIENCAFTFISSTHSSSEISKYLELVN